MALSNILREPQREITETVVGLAIVGGALAVDYWFSAWFQDVTGGPQGCPWPIGMMLGTLLGILLLGALILAHKLGDVICTAVEMRGIQIRPRNRR